ncbi:MAG TPA: hypothetical protein VLB73_04570 [Patescibacteria group bacterium]|nr:hypothetical protein [Patescibacteria group bacterium]
MKARSAEQTAEQLGLKPGDFAIAGGMRGSEPANRKLVKIGETYSPGSSETEERIMAEVVGDGSSENYDRRCRIFTSVSLKFVERYQRRVANQRSSE